MNVESDVEGYAYPQVDYRWFRYSRFALPWLIFMVLWFIALLCLTLWQGGFTINHIRNGVPRDLEPHAKDDDGDGGLPRPVRNLRFAAAIMSIVPILLVTLIFYVRPSPKLNRGVLLVAAVILFFAGVCALIAFCIDVGRTDEAKECVSERLPGNPPFADPNPFGIAGPQVCETRIEYAIAVTALDATTCILAWVGACVLAIWGKYILRERHDPWERARDRALDDQRIVDAAGFDPVIPGQATVYKTLVFLALFALLISAILLIIFSILIHEFRERWFRELAGWPRENSRLRLAATIIGVCLVGLSLVPYPHRVYAYMLCFLWFCLCVIFFVIFGIDVDDLKESRHLGGCDGDVSCIYHPYNTIVVFDFICGFLIAVYIIVEFIAHRRRSLVAAREYAPTDDLLPADFDLSGVRVPGAIPFKTIDPYPIAPAAIRPRIGVEVVEIQNPATGDVNLTVSAVTTGTAAAAAGLRVGDIIARWDDMPIRTKADFANAVNDSQIGSTAVLQVIRNNPLGPGTGTQVDYCRLPIRAVPA
jgi:hypothetical protein